MSPFFNVLTNKLLRSSRPDSLDEVWCALCVVFKSNTRKMHVVVNKCTETPPVRVSTCFQSDAAVWLSPVIRLKAQQMFASESVFSRWNAAQLKHSLIYHTASMFSGTSDFPKSAAATWLTQDCMQAVLNVRQVPAQIRHFKMSTLPVRPNSLNVHSCNPI